MTHTVLHFGPADNEGYHDIVFLEPVGSGTADAVVAGKLRTPIPMKGAPIFDQETRQRVIGHEDDFEITHVTCTLHGQTRCQLAGDIVELTIDGETVWSA